MEGFERSSNEPVRGVTPPIRAGKFLAPPRQPGQLERTALLALLEQFEGGGFILISACAGYGKTILLQQYRERCIAKGRTVLWCNLDAADNDLARLASILHSGLQDLGLVAATDCIPTDCDPAQWLLEHIAAGNGAFTLLLDDFDAIQNPSVLDFFQQLLKALPPRTTLAIAMRATPEINLGRLRARGQLLEIGTQALRFSLDETTCYILQCRQLSFGNTEINTLYERTEGWITGIYLATLSLQWQSDPATFIATFSGSNPALAEYLVEDVLARQPEPIQAFLLQTSVLPQFSAELCDAVRGTSDSKSMIESLQRANLFTRATDNQGQWFRYHNLFADVLLQTLQQQHPGLSAQLNRDAARWYFTVGRPVDALEYLFAAHDIDEAARQLVLHVDTLVENGHACLLMRWLSLIPSDIRDLHPGLGIAYGWALVHARRYKEALEVIESPLLAGTSHCIRPLLLLISDRVNEALAVSREQLQRLTPQDKAQYRFTAFVQACSLLYTGDYDQARQLLGSAELREAQRESTYLRDASDSLEGMLDLVQGQLDNALTRLRAAAQRNGESLGGGRQVGYPTLHTTLCLVLYEADALDEARQRLVELLPYAKDHAAPDALITSHVLLARIAYLDGDRQGWMRHLADLDQLGQVADSSRILCSTWLERARIATLENRLDTAAHAMRSAEQLSDWEQPGVVLTANDVDTPFIARQRLQIAQGDYSGVEALRQAISDAERDHQQRRALKLRLLLALALEALKLHKEALEQLTQALRFAGHVGFVRTFLDEGTPMASLLERWAVTLHGQDQALGIQTGFVDRLSQRFSGSKVVEPKAAAGDSNVNLSARELQVLRLLALGYRNKEIAEKMFLSELTVKSHLRKINSKLGAGGRTEAVSIARTKGLLD
jgi:LuxR family maltose regulon positive regulatory protein